MKQECVKNIGKFLFLMVIVYGVGFISSQFMSADSFAWYKTLQQSQLTPPDYWFGIVWNILYFLMAISAYLVWNKASPRFFVLQLICNGLWPFLFFYMRNPLFALIDIVIMLIFILLTVKAFYKASKLAAYLFAPLIIWSCFALYLNAYIVLN